MPKKFNFILTFISKSYEIGEIQPQFAPTSIKSMRKTRYSIRSTTFQLRNRNNMSIITTTVAEKILSLLA